MMTKQTKFILAIVLQVVIILAIILFKLSILAGGTQVLLQIEPIDPRSLLRGDYITFQYVISNINSSFFEDPRIIDGDVVYVVLRQTGKYWIAQRVYKSRPPDGEIFIKGKVLNGAVQPQDDVFSLNRFSGSRVQIVYGIEEYFIPEGKGRGFSFAGKEASAGVVVDEDGNPVLKQIYIDGMRWP